MYLYTYSITRYGGVESTIETPSSLTHKREIIAFYKREITAADRALIIEAYNIQGFLDGFDYIKNNLIEREPHRGPCKYAELMGGSRFCEELGKIGDNHFSVLLGS